MASVDPPPRRRRNVALVLAFIVSCAVCFVLGVYQGSARDDALGVREILKLPEGCSAPRLSAPARVPHRPGRAPLRSRGVSTVRQGGVRACPACDPCPAPAIAERTERESAGANAREASSSCPRRRARDVDVEDDKIVSAKDESETRERKSEKTTTARVRVDDVGARGRRRRVPGVRGVSDMNSRARRAPTRQPSAGSCVPGDGDGDGGGDGRVPALRRVSGVCLSGIAVSRTRAVRTNPRIVRRALVRGDERSARARGRTSRSARARRA